MPTEKKLRIIHTEASPHWGGQEIRIFEEMKWFREQGHEMILVAPNNGTLYKRCKEEGFKVISVYFTKPRTLINIVRMLWIIWHIKPDVIGTHSSTDSWAGLIAAYLLKIKKRVRYRHVTTQIRNNFLNRLQYEKLCNTVFTTANCISINLQNMFNISRVFCFPTPLSIPDNIPRKETCKDIVKKRLNLPDSSILVGQVSVIRSWKGHDILIKEFKRIFKLRPYIHLLFIGDGPHFFEVKKLITENNLESNIHMVGHCENIWTIIKSLDVIFLASTKNEAIPQCLTQAMYAEVPIIASDVGGIPEIIKHEKTGLLFGKNCYNDIKYHTFKFLDNEEFAKKITLRAKCYSTQRFSWETIGKKILEIFNNE